MEPSLFIISPLKHPFSYTELFKTLFFKDFTESDVMSFVVMGLVTIIVVFNKNV